MMPSSRTTSTSMFDSWDAVCFEAACARSAPFTENLESLPHLKFAG